MLNDTGLLTFKWVILSYEFHFSTVKRQKEEERQGRRGRRKTRQAKQGRFLDRTEAVGTAEISPGRGKGASRCVRRGGKQKAAWLREAGFNPGMGILTAAPVPEAADSKGRKRGPL